MGLGGIVDEDLNRTGTGSKGTMTYVDVRLFPVEVLLVGRCFVNMKRKQQLDCARNSFL
jgi:hypothetical protein